MSHFMLGVIVPKGTENIEEFVNTLMNPCNENMEVEPYEDECSCIGVIARREATKHAESLYGPFSDIRDSFNKNIKKPYWEKLRAEHEDATNWDIFDMMDESEYLDTEWKKAIEGYVNAEKEFFENHPLKDKPDPTCGFYSGERREWWPENIKEGDRFDDASGCAGTGHYTSTYNPNSKWDWWDFGGRWNGVITGYPKDDDQGGFNFGAEYRQLGSNIAEVADVLATQESIDAVEKESGKNRKDMTMIPYALLTPDGVWHQKGQMGWWGMDHDVNSNWKEDALRILKEHADCYIIGIDCHI